MLTKWFGTRPTRSLKKDHSFRPWLEILEARNAPGGGGGHGGGHDGGDDQGGDDGHGHHGPPKSPPGGVGNSSITSSVNAQGSFNNSTITDSFNNTINYTINLMPGQQAAVGGLLGISGLLSSAFSSPQLGSLLSDEVALAVDTYLTTPPISAILPSSVENSLLTDKATLNAAVSANPLEGSPIGAALGNIVYHATLNALTTAQPTI